MKFMFSFLSTYHLLILVFIFGAIIGSFLNVVIYRLHTGRNLSGHSHCLSCGTNLRWYHLFPLFSYLFLRGRCQFCTALISVRYFVVELITAILFTLGVMTNLITDLKTFILYGLIFSVLVIITVYDFNHFIIPDEMTLLLILSTIILLLVKYQQGLLTIADLKTDFLVAIIGTAFFGFLWLISKGEWLGLGDVKLAFPLGLLVGYKLVFSFIVVSFWLGAIISLLMIYLTSLIVRGKTHLPNSHKTLTMKSAVPFAPFLVLGSLLTLFTDINVLSLFSFV